MVFTWTQSKALGDRLEARVPNLLTLNARTQLSDLDLQRPSQFEENCL